MVNNRTSFFLHRLVSGLVRINLYMRIALDYPEIIDYGSANLPESYQMDFFWRDTLAISTNLGFALELLLKLLLYQDSGKISKTHSLGRVYAGMSPGLKNVMANVVP